MEKWFREEEKGMKRKRDVSKITKTKTNEKKKPSRLRGAGCVLEMNRKNKIITVLMGKIKFTFFIFSVK